MLSLNFLALMLNVLNITLTHLYVKHTHRYILMIFILVLHHLFTPHYLHFVSDVTFDNFRCKRVCISSVQILIISARQNVDIIFVIQNHTFLFKRPNLSTNNNNVFLARLLLSAYNDNNNRGIIYIVFTIKIFGR